MDLRRLQAALTTPPDADTPVVPIAGMAELPQLAESVSAPAAQSAEPPSPTDPTAPAASDRGMGDYQRLQRRLLAATAAATALAVPVSGWFFGGPTALSLLVGGLAGLLYLLLLARSVSRLGGDRKSVGKVQLLVPVVLVLAAARIPALEILPALLGFLLYKPALILQAVLDS
jgi:ATP synthase protein I